MKFFVSCSHAYHYLKITFFALIFFAEEQSKRTLFVKNLPVHVTEAKLKALSPDILMVNIHMSYKGKQKQKARGSVLMYSLFKISKAQLF